MGERPALIAPTFQPDVGESRWITVTVAGVVKWSACHVLIVNLLRAVGLNHLLAHLEVVLVDRFLWVEDQNHDLEEAFVAALSRAQLALE